MTSCRFNGASIAQLKITDHSEVTELRLNGSKVNEMGIEASKLEDVKISATACRNVEIGHSTIQGFRFESNDLVRVKVTRDGIESDAIHSDDSGTFYLDFNAMRANRARLEDVKLHQMQISNCRFTNCKLNNVSLSGFEMKDLTVTDLHIQDRQITRMEQLSDIIAESTTLKEAS